MYTNSDYFVISTQNSVVRRILRLCTVKQKKNNAEINVLYYELWLKTGVTALFSSCMVPK